MNKQTYLNELTEHLAKLSSDERNQILRDVEEHFREAASHGRTDESVIKLLGTPKSFADMMIAESKVSRIEKATTITSKLRATFGALMAIIVLAPFNIIFVFLPLLFTTLFIALTWFVGLGFIVSLPVFAILALLLTFKIGFKLFLLLALFCFAIGWVGLVVAIMMAIYGITYIYFKGLSSVLTWNLQFIKRSMRS